jgi:hypothetical protein
LRGGALPLKTPRTLQQEGCSMAGCCRFNTPQGAGARAARPLPGASLYGRQTGINKSDRGRKQMRVAGPGQMTG